MQTKIIYLDIFDETTNNNFQLPVQITADVSTDFRHPESLPEIVIDEVLISDEDLFKFRKELYSVLDVFAEDIKDQTFDAFDIIEDTKNEEAHYERKLDQEMRDLD
tara:strand:- start:343 stop:660 length:318 start_codon:yes stop_codon:yes gene_type:complete